MAYTIISQNNSTTTLSDGVNTITVPSRVNLTSGNFTIVEVNNNMATLEDGDGNVYRDIPCVVNLVDVGGGGSALPDQTGHSGEFLTTDGTDASWSDKPLVNTATGTNSLTVGGTAASVNYSMNVGNGSQVTGQWCCAVGNGAKALANSSNAIGHCAETSSIFALAVGNCKATATNAIQIGSATNTPINNDANTVKIANANGNFEIMSANGTIPTDRYTTTPSADGTYYPTLTISSGTPTRSWSTIAALQNTATGTLSFATGNATATGNYSLALGDGASATANSCVALGESTVATKEGSVLINARSSQNKRCVVIGRVQTDSMKEGSILINSTSSGANMGLTNANSFYIMNSNGLYELLSSDGTIPTARLTKVNSTITLTAAGWSGGSQTVTVSGITATGVVLVSPDPTDQSAYTSAGILCTAQAADSLTFTATTTPSADIDVNVVML